MKVALVQLQPGNNPEKNLEHAKELISTIENQDLIVLPEAFISPFGTEPWGETEKIVKELSTWAQNQKATLVAGSIAEFEGEKLYNTSYVFGPDGNLLGKHRKVHMFDVDLPDVKTMESDTYASGDQTSVIQTPVGNLGVTICFDLRFPEMFIHAAELGAHTIVVPAAFSYPTGEQHWDLLLRARALDSQCFILGCGQAPNEELKFKTYGHSLISDPNGTILDNLGEQEGILYYEYNPEVVYDLRERLPVLKSRKPEAYKN